MRGPKNPRLRRDVVKAPTSGEKFSSMLKLLRRHLGFLKFQIFNGRNGQDGRSVSSDQIS